MSRMLSYIYMQSLIFLFLLRKSMSYRCSLVSHTRQSNLFSAKAPSIVKQPYCGTALGAMKTLQTDVLVIGSGISGSTAAYYLQKNGLDVILAEVKDEVGGNLISKRADGFLWEEGPNSFQPNSAILRLAKNFNMLDKLVLADPTLPRFVFWDGILHALPSGILDLLNFNLLSWSGKIRAGLGAFGFIEPKPNKEETVKEFVTRHLGEEAFERIIDPFVSGVYAGNPMTLSMSAALKKVKNLEDIGFTNGIIEGAVRRMLQMNGEKQLTAERDADLPTISAGSLGSFQDGLQSIALKVKDVLGEKVKLSHKLMKIAQYPDKNEWIATFLVNKSQTKIRAKAILFTSPAHVTSQILSQSEGEGFDQAAKELNKIYYPPVASVTLAYPNEAFKSPLNGFGHLIPRAMKIRTLGTIWSSSLFPGRAPPGYSMLLSYIGGAQDPGIVQLSKEEIVAQVHMDIKRILLKDIAGFPKVLGMRLWPKAIPQYELGHQEVIDNLNRAVVGHKGLFLGGNYKTGVAFGDCVQFGTDVAQNITSFLRDGG